MDSSDMQTFVVTPDIWVDAWDAEDARQRMRQLFDWMQDCPLLDIGIVMPEGCVEKFSEYEAGSADEEDVF